MADGNVPGDRYRPVVRNVWDAISIYDGPDEFLRQFRQVPIPTGHLYAAHWCQSEVRNGGLHQFFTNSTGVLSPEALAGFRAIGLFEWAEILEEAMRFFGDTYPRDRAVRVNLLDQCTGDIRKEWDPFYALDDRFYVWLHAEPDRWDRAADQYAADSENETACSMLGE